MPHIRRLSLMVMPCAPWEHGRGGEARFTPSTRVQPVASKLSQAVHRRVRVDGAVAASESRHHGGAPDHCSRPPRRGKARHHEKARKHSDAEHYVRANHGDWQKRRSNTPNMLCFMLTKAAMLHHGALRQSPGGRTGASMPGTALHLTHRVPEQERPAPGFLLDVILSSSGGTEEVRTSMFYCRIRRMRTRNSSRSHSKTKLRDRKGVSELSMINGPGPVTAQALTPHPHTGRLRGDRPAPHFWPDSNRYRVVRVIMPIFGAWARKSISRPDG